MQEIIDRAIANLASAESYKVAQPYADKICKMFAIPLLANENSVSVAVSAMLSWRWRVQIYGVPQIELKTVCAQLVEITKNMRTDCAHKAEEAYKEADDAN